MTSITHAASSSSVRPARPAHAVSGTGRFRFGADSKALRVGVGVAIAAVLAGDVYAVLRSPVSEGASAARQGASSAAAVADGTDASTGRGFVATNPFSEAAYAAELASRSVVPVAAASSGAAVPATATAPVLSAPAVSTPAFAPSLLPANATVPTVTPPAGPPASTQDGGPQAESPTAALLAPVVELVPQAAPVAAIVEEVVDAVPVSGADSTSVIVSEVVPDAVSAPAGVPSGLPL